VRIHHPLADVTDRDRHSRPAHAPDRTRRRGELTVRPNPIGAIGDCPIPGAGTAGQIVDDSDRVAPVQDVVARTAPHAVRAPPAADRIASRTTKQPVTAPATGQPICSLAPAQPIVARPTSQHVPSTTAQQPVVTPAAPQPVIATEPADHIVARRTGQHIRPPRADDRASRRGDTL
jgi:hypothetical protein